MKISSKNFIHIYIIYILYIILYHIVYYICISTPRIPNIAYLPPFLNFLQPLLSPYPAFLGRICDIYIYIYIYTYIEIIYSINVFLKLFSFYLTHH